MGNPSASYTVAKQEFLNSVINKIGKQEWSDQAWSNPIKRLKGGFIENASDIEEIYVGRVDKGTYDPDGTGQFDRVKPTVLTQYHTSEVEHAYKATVQDKQMRKGFTTKGGLSTMANHIVASIHTGAEVDEYEDILKGIGELVSDTTGKQASNEVVLAKPTSEASSKAFCKKVKQIIPKMSLYTDVYSAVENFAKPSDLVLFLDSDVDVEISTEYLAGVFNMSVAELNNLTKIVVPNLATAIGVDEVYAVMCHHKCIKVHPTFYNMESCRNTRGKFTNYDLVVSNLISHTNWFPWVAFKSK